MRIGFCSTEWIKDAGQPGGHRGGGTLWYRFQLPARFLQQAGYDVRVGRLVGHPTNSGELGVATWDGEVSFECDMIVLQRYMNPALVAEVKRAQALGQVIVNDVDDHFDGIPQTNQAFWTTRRGGRNAPNRSQRRRAPKGERDIQEPTDPMHAGDRESYRRVMSAGDAVFCSTPALADRYDKLGVRTIVLRNAIDIDRWQVQEVADTSEAIGLGWYGALGFRSGGDFRALSGLLGPWLRQNPKRRFHYGGASKPEDVDTLVQRFGLVGVNPRQLIVNAGVPIEELPSLVTGYDIGLVPLEDTPFNHAKSCLKAMENAAAGIPVVASALPEQEWFSDAGRGVLTVRNAKQWRQAWDRLSDVTERRRMSVLARQRAEECSIQRNWHHWESAILDLCGVPERALQVES